ncbi:succinate dehydrogenase/Fumarate reductase transmembrane subunit domain-containing protein [Ditylenchus destructor]|nr:succinate dehydrogenase/Fumarate reductase transmembrane subunit domain-containing protein [Ditylenchus destructor]
MSTVLILNRRVCNSLARLNRGTQIAHVISSSRLAHAKTPLQEFGAEYLKKQEKSNRPISPHLSIYQPQLTWYLSGLHRITGCVMAGTLLVGGAGFAVFPVDFTCFIGFIQGLHLPSIVLDSAKFIVAFPIFFHALNGIRFLGYDIAIGADLTTIYRTGWVVVGLSVVLSVLVILNSKRHKLEKRK